MSDFMTPERMREIRRALDWTQKRMAVELGCKRGRVSQLETGTGTVDLRSEVIYLRLERQINPLRLKQWLDAAPTQLSPNQKENVLYVLKEKWGML